MKTKVAPSRVAMYLKTCRETAGISQSDLAKKFKWGSPQYVSNIERGLSEWPLKSLKKAVKVVKGEDKEVLFLWLKDRGDEIQKVLKCGG